MLYIICFPPKSVCTRAFADAVRFVFPHKQQEKCPFLSMMDISLPGSGIFRRRALALPMEKLVSHRIVLIHRRRRIILVRLVECDKGNVNFLIRQILYAFANGSTRNKPRTSSKKSVSNYNAKLLLSKPQRTSHRNTT